jgi:Activator of Hsp90 ATPase homolog 1-like protein
VRVKTSPAEAFEVFTRDVALWWRPNPLFAFTRRPPGRVAFEPGPGGRFLETSADGDVFEIGRIRLWKPGEALVFSWRQASFAADQETEVEVRFDPVGDETRVTVRHRGWESVPAEHVARHGFPDAVFLRRHGEWWQDLLASLRARAEGAGSRPR